MTENELELRLEGAKKERQFLKWLLVNYVERRLSTHGKRLEHLQRMGADVKMEISSSRKMLSGEDFPEIWVDYKFDSFGIKGELYR